MMVTKSRNQTTVEKEQKKGRVKVGKLKLNKETVKDLTRDEARQVKGGVTAGCYDGVRGGASGGCFNIASQAANCR